jgi:hypothetical protein
MGIDTILVGGEDEIKDSVEVIMILCIVFSVVVFASFFISLFLFLFDKFNVV